MATKLIENKIVVGFAQKMLHEYRPLPMTLLRHYERWGLNERELIRLLRIIAPIFDRGYATAGDIAAEFGVEESGIAGLLAPYLARNMLEYDPDYNYYTCNGLMNSIYESWAATQRPSLCRREPAPPETAPCREQLEEAVAISHLYHRFEQELGRNLTYTESDRLRSWLDEEGFPPPLIEEALSRAVIQGKCTLAYIRSILRDWQKKQLTTVEMVRALDVKPTTPAEKRRGKAAKPAAEEDDFADVYRAAKKAGPSGA